MAPMQHKWILSLVMSALLVAGCGLTAPRGSEGYADLDSLGVFDVDNTMSLSIGPALLRFAARYLDDEPELQELMRDLDGVRVRIYEIDGDAQRVAERMENMSVKLRAREWEPVALVQEDGQQVHMLIKSSSGRIHGLTVLTTDGEEAVIVNIMGDMKPEFFSNAMVALEIDAPEIEIAAIN